MSILIKKAGFLDTFQDLGRKGFRELGINPGGAMDKTACRLINILLGNDENETVLEMHFPAAVIKFEDDAVFALGGADFNATLSNKPVANWTLLTAKKGQILKFNEKLAGNRSYLAIKGGYKLNKWLGSSGTNLIAEVGGLEGRKLEKEDRIEFNTELSTKINKIFPVKIARSIIPRYSRSPTVRITKGAEYLGLTALSEQILLSNNYKITQNSDRMGFRLNGKSLHLLSEKELVSTAVEFGTIQLLPDGQLIVLMTDHQTTGGYPRIGHVIEKDLPLIAQLTAGDSLGFYLVSQKKAEDVNVKFEKDLDFLKIGIKFSKYLK